jgi:hypothetical protein
LIEAAFLLAMKASSKLRSTVVVINYFYVDFSLGYVIIDNASD